jgi:hypothetical protein
MTDSTELSHLIAAASHVSTDAQAPEPEKPTVRVVDKYAADERQQPDAQYEDREVKAVMKESYAALSPVERKLLRMKGIDVGL